MPSPSSSSLPREQAGASPQRLLGALLADYSLEGTPGLSSAAVVRILGEFGVSESGARSALSRATQRGLLQAERTGADIRYTLGAWGRSVHQERLGRVLRFGAGRDEWDGRWTVAVLAAHPADRVQRRRRRQRLADAGFGELADHVWIHPWADPQQVRALAADEGLPIVVGRTELTFDGVSAADAFDLAGLRAGYAAFLDEYEPHAEAAAGEVTGAGALLIRASVLRDWRRLSLEDPELPASVLPADWPQQRARSVFLQLRTRLAPAALAHLRTLVDPDVADLIRDVDPPA